MNTLILLEQAFNGVQFGVMLFLMAAGLTLIFGIMNLVNLAHGSFYMVGAYLALTIQNYTGSFVLGILLAIPATMVVGIAVELIALRTLYDRDHLDQVLATFGLILFFNELMAMIWGRAALFSGVPDFLAGHVEIIPGAPYPIYRLVIIGVGVLVAIFLYVLITRTRIGMLIRAGASNRAMVSALGIDIKLLYTLVFGLGAALAGLAGMMMGPIRTVIPGMAEMSEEPILIQTFVVIVIGGIGSIRGAFVAAVLVGLVDTVGRAFLPLFFELFMRPDAANTAGPAAASMLIYILMAAVLFFRPQGLFPAHAG